MSTKSIPPHREAFEEWAKDNFYPKNFVQTWDGGYTDEALDSAWLGFDAGVSWAKKQEKIK